MFETAEDKQPEWWKRMETASSEQSAIKLQNPLHRRIAEARNNVGMSQLALASRLGIGQSAVSQWESGHGAPDARILLAIARALGVTTDWLLGSDLDDGLPDAPSASGQMDLITELSAALATKRLSWQQSRILSDVLREFTKE